MAPPKSVSSLAQTAANPMAENSVTNVDSQNSNQSMNFPNPNVGVLNPPNKVDMPLTADAFEEKDKLRSLPKPIKKGGAMKNLVLIGKLVVFGIGAFYMGKGLKHVGSKIWKLLNR